MEETIPFFKTIILMISGEYKISEIVLDKKKIKIEKSDNFCLESNNVSTDICETLKKTRI